MSDDIWNYYGRDLQNELQRAQATINYLNGLLDKLTQIISDNGAWQFNTPEEAVQHYYPKEIDDAGV